MRCWEGWLIWDGRGVYRNTARIGSHVGIENCLRQWTSVILTLSTRRTSTMQLSTRLPSPRSTPDIVSKRWDEPPSVHPDYRCACVYPSSSTRACPIIPSPEYAACRLNQLGLNSTQDKLTRTHLPAMGATSSSRIHPLNPIITLPKAPRHQSVRLSQPPWTPPPMQRPKLPRQPTNQTPPTIPYQLGSCKYQHKP